MKFKAYICNYDTPGYLVRSRNDRGAFKSFSRAIFHEPPGEITNEQFDDTIWYEAYCNAQRRTMCIPKEIILDWLYNNGYKELFEDE